MDPSVIPVYLELHIIISYLKGYIVHAGIVLTRGVASPEGGQTSHWFSLYGRSFEIIVVETPAIVWDNRCAADSPGPLQRISEQVASHTLCISVTADYFGEKIHPNYCFLRL